MGRLALFGRVVWFSVFFFFFFAGHNNWGNLFLLFISLEFHGWSFFFPFYSPLPLVFVLFFIFFTHTARRNWTRYGKQTALPGRYQSNCLLIWFAVGFTSSPPFLIFFLISELDFLKNIIFKISYFKSTPSFSLTVSVSLTHAPTQ